MKIIQCKASNFLSYSDLDISLKDRGLTLIHGPTGAGKSTIPDAICWALFGETPKNVAVDEVKSWKTPNAKTEVSVVIESKGSQLTINRVRDSGKNDLYFTQDGVLTRGKDSLDTQKLINKRLGIDAETYFASAYYHEFNTIGTFFTAKLKDRKELFEKIADLSFPNSLEAKAKTKSKNLKDLILATEKEVVKIVSKIDQLQIRLENELKNQRSWAQAHEQTLKSLKDSNNNFIVEKTKKLVDLTLKKLAFEMNKSEMIAREEAEINIMSATVKNGEELFKDINEKHEMVAKNTCKECGQKLTIEETMREILSLQKEHEINNKKIREINTKILNLEHIKSFIDPNIEKSEELIKSSNPYEDILKKEYQKENPFTSYTQLLFDLTSEKGKRDLALSSIRAHTKETNLILNLCDVIPNVRVELLELVVNRVQDSTNSLLERFFDSELKIALTIKDDKIDACISKSGYNCSFKQLSKGQRKLLGLCFTVSVMQEVANNSSIKIDTVFMDEPTDGFDIELKVKSFKLFEALLDSHSSIFIIEHSSDLKALFSNDIHVNMEADESYIE